MRTSSEKTIEKYFEVLRSASEIPILTTDAINAITKKYKINKTWYSYAVRLGILSRNLRGVYMMWEHNVTRENAKKLLNTMNEKQNKTKEVNCCGSLATKTDYELVKELRNRGYVITATKTIEL